MLYYFGNKGELMIQHLKLTTYTASAIEHNKTVQDLTKETYKEIIFKE